YSVLWRLPPPPPLPLVPYTTLFRSSGPRAVAGDPRVRGPGLGSAHRNGGGSCGEGRFGEAVTGPLCLLCFHVHRYRHHPDVRHRDRKSTRLNSSHVSISYAVFCLKK